jgi:hypothetical protein
MTCQLLFLEEAAEDLRLDLVTLEEGSLGGMLSCTAGRPVAMALTTARADARTDELVHVLRRWADSCAVFELDLVPHHDGKAVVLSSSQECVVLAIAA